MATGVLVPRGMGAEHRAVEVLWVATDGSHRIEFMGADSVAVSTSTYDAAADVLGNVLEGRGAAAAGVIGAGPFAYTQDPLWSDWQTAFRALASSMVELAASGAAQSVEHAGRPALSYEGELVVPSPAELDARPPERYRVAAVVDEETLLPLEVSVADAFGASVFVLDGFEEVPYDAELFASPVVEPRAHLAGRRVDPHELSVDGRGLLVPEPVGAFELTKALHWEGGVPFPVGRTVDGSGALRDVVAVEWRDGYRAVVALLAPADGLEWADPYPQVPLSATTAAVEVRTSSGTATFELVYGFGVETHAFGVVANQFVSVGGDVSVEDLMGFLSDL